MEIRQANSQSEFFSLMRIRFEVFMCEQKVDPLLEIDPFDQTCQHFIIIVENTIIGTCRVIKENNSWQIGRFAIIKSYRNKGYGKALLRAIEKDAGIDKIEKIQLHSQIQAVPFYANAGYVSIGKVFKEANIEHIRMEKDI